MIKINPIPDYIRENLAILFVGFNPSIKSSEMGHHFANPNNRFWSILYKANLTSRKFVPNEDYQLLDIGYGLTNIVARPTKTAQEITKEEYQKGKKELRRKIERYRPKIVCFVGKGVYQEYCGCNKVLWGVQEVPVVAGTIDFVAPSSSGLVRMRIDEIVEIYKTLNELKSL